MKFNMEPENKFLQKRKVLWKLSMIFRDSKFWGSLKVGKLRTCGGLIYMPEKTTRRHVLKDPLFPASF